MNVPDDSKRFRQMNSDTEFMMERRLRRDSPQLHQLFRSTVFSLQNLLTGYARVFPEFTDHSELHSIEVAAFCNALIGFDQIDMLNADEIYILLMGCYLHDIGMGTREKELDSLLAMFDSADYLATHDRSNVGAVIRDLHHELSGAFIRKHADLWEIPSPEHLFSIVQVSRGHRKTDLYDETEYPADYQLPNGNIVRLPYLAALIRLADEIDVASSRNLGLLFSPDQERNGSGGLHFAMHKACRALLVEPDRFVMENHTDDPVLRAGLAERAEKMQETLDYCRDVTEKRTPFHITQKTVEQEYI